MVGSVKPALQAFLEEQFEGAFYVRKNTVVVAGTPTLLAPNNYERLGLIIINLSTADLYIAPDSGVSTAAGILLTGSGSTASMTARDDLVLVGYDWHALSADPPANVYVLEVIRYRG